MSSRLSTSPIQEGRRFFVRRFQERPLLRPTHPVRAAIFLTLNLIGYAAANAFLCYLSTGEWFIQANDYAQAANRPLGSILIRPLNVMTHPWMIVVFSLLLTAVIVIPLLVACLYHSRYCVLFLGCVAGLAQAPVLTLVLATGCVLVAATPLRHKAPMLAILLGLLPVGTYFYFSGSRLPILPQPMHRLVLFVPFIITGIASVSAAAIVLLIAKLTRYLPGVIWPITILLVAAPFWLFHSRVGPAELEYAVLSEQLSPAKGLFAEQALIAWQEQKASTGQPTDLPQALLDDLASRKAGVVARCDRFIARHGQSARLPSVWWIRGMALDMQVNFRRLESGETRLVQFYNDSPPCDGPAAERSSEHWRRMVQLIPNDPCSGEAWWRLALLTMRPETAASESDDAPPEQGAADRLKLAGQMLSTAAEMLASARQVVPAPSGPLKMFSEDPGLPAREHLVRLANRVAEARWLLRVNDAMRGDANAAAFMAYISLDEDSLGLGEYQQFVRVLSERYHDTSLCDNFRLADALCRLRASERASALRALEDEPGSDAAIRANYELGLLALQGVKDLLPAAEYFRRVARDNGENPWRQAAEEHYQRLLPVKETP